MANIQFNYLYRDGGNYKKYGSVIFANPGDVDVGKVEVLIQTKLIDQTWFYRNHWQLPNLRAQTFNPDTDPTWHEFESLSPTHQAANNKIMLVGFTVLVI
jgi:hypothetical protein